MIYQAEWNVNNDDLEFDPKVLEELMVDSLLDKLRDDLQAEKWVSVRMNPMTIEEYDYEIRYRKRMQVVPGTEIRMVIDAPRKKGILDRLYESWLGLRSWMKRMSKENNLIEV